MALYSLAFYCIYHLIFDKKYIFYSITQKQNVRDRILTRYETWLLHYNYLWMTKSQPCVKQICLSSMHLCNIKRYKQKYARNFGKLLG